MYFVLFWRIILTHSLIVPGRENKCFTLDHEVAWVVVPDRAQVLWVVVSSREVVVCMYVFIYLSHLKYTETSKQQFHVTVSTICDIVFRMAAVGRDGPGDRHGSEAHRYHPRGPRP